MNHPALTLFVLLALTCSASAADVARETQDPSVVIAYSEPELESVARRVRAELRTAGRDDIFLERRSPLGTCTSRKATEDTSGQVGILLETEGDGLVVAEICVSPQPNQVTVLRTLGRLDKEGDLAIVITEALHGLLIAPLPENQHDARPAPPAENSEATPASARASSGPVPTLSLGSRWVLDAPTGEYFFGLVPRIEAPVHGKVSLVAELFLGLVPVGYSDELIELESHLAWARFGFSASDSFGPFRLGWDLSGGLFSNLATADATRPRQGGSDSAFGAVLGASAYGEFPKRGFAFLSGSLGVSTLLPRLNYQLSEGTTPQVGAFLVEGGIGLGLRLGRQKM